MRRKLFILFVPIFMIAIISSYSGCIYMADINTLNADKLRLKNKEKFEITHLGATARVSMKFLRSSFKRNRIAELYALKNLPVEKISNILSDKFGISVSWDRIKSLPPVDPGEGIDHGYIKNLGKYKHGNRVIIKYIYRIQEGFYFNFFFEAFYRITIFSEDEILLDFQKNFDIAISPDWNYVIKLSKKIPMAFEKDLENKLKSKT